MKKFIVLILALLLVFPILQAKSKKGFVTTDSGLKYKITKKGKGIQPKPGDRVQVHYTGKLQNGIVFDSSISRRKPFEFELGAGRVIKGWEEGIALLHEGDKATLIIPPELGYGSKKVGKIPANSTIIFDVELVKVIPKPQIKPFDIEGKPTIYSSSGIKFIIVEAGEGESPKKGQTVVVNYTGYLPNGTMFDSSFSRGKPFEFKLGVGQVIKGWDEGVSFMKKGGKIRFIIPWKLAYGERGRPPKIPPKTDLTFDIELLDIK